MYLTTTTMQEIDCAEGKCRINGLPPKFHMIFFFVSRRQGGGYQVKKFFLISPYVVALVIFFSKWAH